MPVREDASVVTFVSGTAPAGAITGLTIYVED
jgi:hypothetical protein